MKVSKWNLSPLQIIYGLAIINSLALIFFVGWKTCPDSITYVQAWDVISSGEIDKWRTPIYPIFLGVIQSIVGKEYLHIATICIQQLIFLLSIQYFYQAIRQLCQNLTVVFWITLFYALHPGVSSWNNFILTESLAVIFSVFLIYSALKVWKEASLKACFYFTLWLLLLIFLRPAFVYMLPVSLVAWIMAGFKRKEIRSVSFICIAGVITVSCCQLLYMKAFETKYGVFTPSGISTVNQYCLAKQGNILNPDLIKHPKLKTYIERTINKETDEVFDHFELRDIQDAVSVSNKNNPIGYIKKAGGRLFRAAHGSYPPSYCEGTYLWLSHLFAVPFYVMYQFLFIYFLVLLYWMYRHKTVPWFSSFLFMLGCSNLIVAIVGAQAEWSRLVLPSLPSIC